MAGTATITITQSDQIPELGLKPSQNEIDAFRSSGWESSGISFRGPRWIRYFRLSWLPSPVDPFRCQRDCSVVSMDEAGAWQRR